MPAITNGSPGCHDHQAADEDQQIAPSEGIGQSPGRDFVYKDIDEVMQLQKDLVKVLHRVWPIINIKG
ncbi:MAG: RtcB family protein [Desulfuromonadales bacterium]|nr:RtcB family protein [Desulfuromonadales bacterium]